MDDFLIVLVAVDHNHLNLAQKWKAFYKVQQKLLYYLIQYVHDAVYTTHEYVMETERQENDQLLLLHTSILNKFAQLMIMDM